MKLNIIYILCCFLISVSISSCQKFLEIDGPFGEVTEEAMFSNESSANSAVTSLYARLREDVMVAGSFNGMGILMGLYADELDNYSAAGGSLDLFQKHQILISNATVKSIWDNSYQTIYMCNTVLNGLEASTGLSVEKKDQLKGEVLFVRSLVYFYLINLFGEVPYIEITDHEANSKVSKLSIETMYGHILDDLGKAKILLSDKFDAANRTRANVYAVHALMARCYLYLEQWDNALTSSNEVLSKSSLFSLLPLDKVFLRNSQEAILQLKPETEGRSTREADVHVLLSGPPLNFALNKRVETMMEAGDLRSQKWIGVLTKGSDRWLFSNKYKERTWKDVSPEYSTVFRLAELYLIRAEAKAMLNDIDGATDDLNEIRTRAELNPKQNLTKELFLDALVQERRVELLAEHGHRWFDLKRWGKADEVLKLVKPSWKPTNILLPLPEAEILMNPNLLPQNTGYQQ